MSQPEQFEVEQKFALDVDADAMRTRLESLGAKATGQATQVDQYFNHPVRDFAQTDEALRIRSVDDRNWVTWKGPKIDSRTKTRREIELPLGDGTQTAEQLAEVLRLLSFRPVTSVQKIRRTYGLTRDGRTFEIALDEVEEVGAFMEIEILAEESELAAAQDAVIRVGDELGLSRVERRSYLALLLERRESESSDG